MPKFSKLMIVGLVTVSSVAYISAKFFYINKGLSAPIENSTQQTTTSLLKTNILDQKKITPKKSATKASPYLDTLTTKNYVAEDLAKDVVGSSSTNQDSNPEKKKNNKKNIRGNIVEIKNNDGTSQQITLLNTPLDSATIYDILQRAYEIDLQNYIYNEQNSSALISGERVSTASDLEQLYIAYDLGMADVPVLQQGQHGSCATFANTAALQAKMNAGDLISQQCLLALGNYINQIEGCENNEQPRSENDTCSGWDGFYDTTTVLARIKQYGIVSKSNCPQQYPLYLEHPAQKQQLNYREYKALSGDLWVNDFSYQKLPPRNLDIIKNSLDNNHRVVAGILLHEDYKTGLPINGKPSGLWDLPYEAQKFAHEMLYENKNSGGHAIVITGYDDDKQLFKARNSWGANIGDFGEFYISYDYYFLLNTDATELY